MNNKNSQKKTKSKILSSIIWLILCAGFVFLILTFVGQRTVVNGESMESTLQDGDSLILDKLSYRFSSPKRYDIVVFPGEYDENGKEVLYIKRIIGLPGEKVDIKNGSVYINDKLLNSDVYAKDSITSDEGEYTSVTLQNGEYYCLGDNREVSNDSRRIGPVNKIDIIGKVVLRIFPFSKFQKFII